jgi:Mg2+/citrate symporter
MNYILTILVLAVLVFGYSFLPWYFDSALAFAAAGYFGYQAFKKRQEARDSRLSSSSNDLLWATVAFALGIIIILTQFDLLF